MTTQEQKNLASQAIISRMEGKIDYADLQGLIHNIIDDIKTPCPLKHKCYNLEIYNSIKTTLKWSRNHGKKR